MSNGQEACSYAKRYCGNQLVQTELGGKTIPTCFPLSSTLCMDWNKVGCDLSQCLSRLSASVVDGSPSAKNEESESGGQVIVSILATALVLFAIF